MIKFFLGFVTATILILFLLDRMPAMKEYQAKHLAEVVAMAIRHPEFKTLLCERKTTAREIMDYLERRK